MAKQNLNVTYQWCFPEKYVEGMKELTTLQS